MKKLLVVAAFALVPGAASADTIGNAVGNTVVAQLPDGSTSEIRLRADGTFTRTLPSGASVEGTWTNGGGIYCETPSGGEQTCPPIPAGKGVGDTWTQTDPDGVTVTISIVAGQ